MGVTPKFKLEALSLLVDSNIKSGKEILDATLADESIPLFDRWVYFLKYGEKFYPVKDYIINNKSVIYNWFEEKNRWPDHRGKQVLYADYFEEYWIDADQIDPLTGERPEWLTEELVDEARTFFEQNLPEEVVRDLLSQGFSGFTFDW